MREDNFITANMEDEESSSKATSIIWWIVSTTTWGIVSMILIVWCFHNRFGKLLVSNVLKQRSARVQYFNSYNYRAQSLDKDQRFFF